MNHSLLQVFGYGDHVQELFFQNRGAMAEAKVSMDSTVYIQLPRERLVILSKKKLRSPVTINIDFASGLDSILPQGEECIILPNGLLNGEGAPIASLQGEVYHNTGVHGGLFLSGNQSTTFSGKDGVALFEAAMGFVRSLNVDGSIMDTNQPMFAKFRRFLDEALCPPPSSSSFDPALFRLLSTDLIGLGNGYTPSFDDFLAGFLSLYNYAHRSASEKILIPKEEIMRKTTWASGSMLDLIQNEVCDEELNQAVLSILKADGRIMSHLQRIASRGHTSGIDMAFGIICSWNALLQQASYNKMQRKILLST